MHLATLLRWAQLRIIITNAAAAAILSSVLQNMNHKTCMTKFSTQFFYCYYGKSTVFSVIIYVINANFVLEDVTSMHVQNDNNKKIKFNQMKRIENHLILLLKSLGFVPLRMTEAGQSTQKLKPKSPRKISDIFVYLYV